MQTMPRQLGDDLECELFWMAQLANALVRRLGGDVTMTEEEIRAVLDYDATWQEDGEGGYQITVQRGEAQILALDPSRGPSSKP